MTATIKALLLDLDNTLLINDMETFAPPYYRALQTKLAGLCPPVRLMEALQIATDAVWHNDGRDGTNEQVFMREFLPRVGSTEEQLRALTDHFYANEFEALAPLTQPDPYARPLLDLARAQGYQIAIATQPVFPREAILARLRWAGVPHYEYRYDFISSYEELSACKPHPEFFRAVLQHLGREPAECLMVGDSAGADMAAGRLGIRTFYLERLPDANRDKVSCDARGTLRDVIDLIQTEAIHAL